VVTTAHAKSTQKFNHKESVIQIGTREENPIATYCVEARIFPSGLNAAAIVDRGAGNKGQYLADKCCNDSASTLEIKFKNVSPRN
jgi:hypothetical protein